MLSKTDLNVFFYHTRERERERESEIDRESKSGLRGSISMLHVRVDYSTCIKYMY